MTGRAAMERAMERTWGPDWRNLAIKSPMAVVRLIDIVDEAFPPPPEPVSEGYGLWQIMSPQRFAMPSPLENAAAMMRRYQNRQPSFTVDRYGSTYRAVGRDEDGNLLWEVTPPEEVT